MHQSCSQVFLCWDTCCQFSELMVKAGFNSLKHQGLEIYVPQKKKDWICNFCILALTRRSLSSTSVMHDSEFLKWNGFSCVVLDHSELILGPWKGKNSRSEAVFYTLIHTLIRSTLELSQLRVYNFLLLCSVISTDGPLGFRNYTAPLQTLQRPPSQNLCYTDQIESSQWPCIQIFARWLKIPLNTDY